MNDLDRNRRTGAVAACVAACLLLPGVASSQAPDRPASAPSGARASDASPARDPRLAACAEAVARRVQERYESIRDLSASFRQETRSVTLGGGPLAGSEAVSGHVVFAKPGRMRWSYEEPAPSLMVSDGKTLWLFDPVAGEASHLPVDRGYLSGAAIQFLMGEGRLLDAFDIRTDRCEQGSAEPVDLELVPRKPESYERMSLRADPRSGEIRRTTIVDLFGNQTTIEFSDVRFDTSPPADTFTFTPPEGVEAVDLITPP